MAAENNNISRSKQVSNMIKQGFIPTPSLTSSPSRPLPLPSPPPVPPHSLIIRSSPTLSEIMTEEKQREIKVLEEKKGKIHRRVCAILADSPFTKDEGIVRDVKLTITSKDGFSMCLNVDRSVLVEESGFFKEKLRNVEGVLYIVEICDCEDIVVYVETIVLMYCDDVKKKLGSESVDKVVDLLKVSSALKFDKGINSCLDFLEEVPWSEDEEEKVLSVLTEIQFHDSTAKVLKRVSAEPSTSAGGDAIFSLLVSGVLKAKDDKARRDMKALIFGLLKEETSAENHISSIDVSGEILYQLCHKSLSALVLCLSEAESMEESKRDGRVLKGEIGREADNLHWLVEIMIEKKLGEEFVKLWADQKELARLHGKMPSVYRYEISRITAQLCIGIGRGQLLVPRDARFSLLQTWLEALYEDFTWMKRACRSLDKKEVEDGLGRTILTLSLAQQQTILLSWFNRFMDKGDDCPNIQNAFEVWWRRYFIRQYVAGKDQNNLQLTVCDYPT